MNGCLFTTWTPKHAQRSLRTCFEVQKQRDTLMCTHRPPAAIQQTFTNIYRENIQRKSAEEQKKTWACSLWVFVAARRKAGRSARGLGQATVREWINPGKPAPLSGKRICQLTENRQREKTLQQMSWSPASHHIDASAATRFMMVEQMSSVTPWDENVLKGNQIPNSSKN